MLPCSRPGSIYAVVGAICLGLVLVALPPLGNEEVGLAEQSLAYASALLPAGAFLYGLLALATAIPTRRPHESARRGHGERRKEPFRLPP